MRNQNLSRMSLKGTTSSVPASEEELETYLNNLRKPIEDDEGSIDPMHLLRMVEFSQLLAVIGQHKEAKPFATRAWEDSQYLENDSMFKIVFYQAGLNLVNLLDFLNEVEPCAKVFEKLDRFNPAGAHLGEYAYFLHRRRRNFDEAEKYYQKALELFPNQSSIHLKYAGFLRHVRRNVAGAEASYRAAVQTGPTNADALGNYASFLHGVYQNVKDAEEYYTRAVEADDTHANNLCNYGLFLSEEKQDFLKAEKMYKRVLEVTPSHANTLYNYAVLLDTHLQRKSEAELLYRRAIEMEPRHAYALYNLAVLLEEKYANEGIFLPSSANNAANSTLTAEKILQKKQEAGLFYQRAAEADPRDATTLADYGRYIFVRLENANMAEPLLSAAVKLDGTCEVALYHLALLFYRDRKSTHLDQAEGLLRQVIQNNPQHANAMLTLARVFADVVQAMFKHISSGGTVANLPSGSVPSSWKGKSKESLSEECVSLYERAIQLAKEPTFIASEYLKFVSSYGSNKSKLAAVKSMGQYATAPAAASAITAAATAANASFATTASGAVVTVADAAASVRALLDELRTNVK